MVTGPPGAGKSSVSEQLVTRRNPSALVPGDDFFAMIKQGRLAPWLPEARQQNTVIIEAAAATAGQLCDIGFVVYDGIVGPWFLPTFVRATGLRELHYVVLLPPLDVCIERVRSRADHGFADLSVTSDMFSQFVNARIADRHVITDSDHQPRRLAGLIDERLATGSFRYSAS